jgi:hypothetical protein
MLFLAIGDEARIAVTWKQRWLRNRTDPLPVLSERLVEALRELVFRTCRLAFGKVVEIRPS